MENLEEVNKLTALKESYDKWASAKGLSLSNYFDILIKKDKNELIDEFDKEFYIQLKQKVASKDVDWILENINVDAYKTYIENKIEEETDRIFSRPKVGTKEEVEAFVKRELAKVYSKYSLDTKTSNGWLLKNDIKK